MLLVTGGCGFVGSNLVARLLERGERVRILDNLSLGALDRLQGAECEVLEGDIRDTDALDRALEGVEVVVHLAAYGSVPESVADPIGNFEVNARGTLGVLEACTRAGASKVIFSSTGGAIMGDAPSPVDETDIPWPVSPYGASKLAGEAYCHAFAGSFGLDSVVLRFANVYGPRSDGKKGAVTSFVKRALRGEPLTIYGDGTATRDFTYVEDICDGILAAIDAPLHDDVFHLATGRETSVADLARVVLEQVGVPGLPVVHEPPRAGDIEHNFARFDLATRVLGYRPAHGVPEGVAKTVEWFDASRPLWDR